MKYDERVHHTLWALSFFFFLIVLPWFGHAFSNKGRFGHKRKLPGFFYFLNLRKALARAMNMMKGRKPMDSNTMQESMWQCDNEPAEQMMLIGESESVVGSRNMQIYYANYNEAAKAVLKCWREPTFTVFSDVGNEESKPFNTALRKSCHWVAAPQFRQPQSHLVG